MFFAASKIINQKRNCSLYTKNWKNIYKYFLVFNNAYGENRLHILYLQDYSV